MATAAEQAVGVTRVAGRRRSSGDTASTTLMVAPALGLLAVFFLLPLYYIVLFSVGMRHFARTPALAKVNGEQTSFTLSIWEKFLGPPVRLEVLGVDVGVPLIVVAIGIGLLLAGAILGTRLPRYGGVVTVASVLGLLAPFMTIPAGNNLLRIAKLDSESEYLALFFKSITLAMTSSVIAVLVALPVAYYLAFATKGSKYSWLLVVIAPFLTSYLLRVFAWKILLSDQGVVNTGLERAGVVAEPLSFLIYSQFTVMVVLTYAWVPFICLPIFIAFENVDRRYLEAATDLGASRLKAFAKITLPIAAPGIVAAFLFVFIPSIGEYITPSLVGGTDGYMFGNAIAAQFVGGLLNWQRGSVLALFLLAVVLILTASTSRFLRAAGGATR